MRAATTRAKSAFRCPDVSSMGPPAYFRRRMGRSQKGAGPAGSSAPGPPARGRYAAVSLAGAALGRGGAAPGRGRAPPPRRGGGGGRRARAARGARGGAPPGGGAGGGGGGGGGRGGGGGGGGGGEACRPADESAHGPP